MSIAPSGPTPPPPVRPGPPGKPPSFVDRLPWEKVLIWGLFLLGIYTLRHLFFIIFMTFLFSFVVRSVVLTLAARLSPSRERGWLERCLTLVTFVVMLFGVSVVFRFLGPQVFEQSRALVERVQATNPKEALEDFRDRTVGAYLFSRKIGSPGEETYEESLVKYREEDKFGEGLYATFQTLMENLQWKFEVKHKGAKLARLQDDVTQNSSGGTQFEQWFLLNKAPGIFLEREPFYTERWLSRFTSAEVNKMAEDPQYHSKRNQQIYKSILQDTINQPLDQEQALSEWRKETQERRWRELRESETYLAEFQAFYEATREADPDGIPFDYDTYLALKNGPHDEERFMELLLSSTGDQDDRDPEVVAQDFKLNKQRELAKQWWDEDAIALWLQSQVVEDFSKLIRAVLDWAQGVIRFAASIPIQLATALILTIFITFDMPRLKQGVRRLHHTRLRNVYAEIAPGLVTFSRLIGRAFAAQGLIAVFNTLLTFGLLWFLAIDNAVFLCTIVFLCSFIPILGVILSSVPIALMAILQPGGTLWLGMQVVMGVCLIHFIETSLLNPKILGDMLHLHPVMVLAILTVGEHFFGVWGLLLGVPIGVFIFRIVILKEEIPGITDRPAAIASASPSLIVAPARVTAPSAAPPPRPPTATPNPGDA